MVVGRWCDVGDGDDLDYLISIPGCEIPGDREQEGLTVAILGAPIEGKAVVKAHAVLAHQLPIEVGETERGQLLARERQVRGL